MLPKNLDHLLLRIKKILAVATLVVREIYNVLRDLSIILEIVDWWINRR